MKKKIEICGLILMILASIVSGQAWTNSNALQGSGNITVISSIQDSDNNLIIYGFFDSDIYTSTGLSATTYGGRDYFVVKSNALGETLWMKTLGSRTNDDLSGGICTNLNNEIYILGGFQNDLLYAPTDSISSVGSYDTFIAKFSSQGDIDTCFTFASGIDQQRGSALNIDTEGNLIVAGFFRDSITLINDSTIFGENNYFHMYLSGINVDDMELIWADAIYSLSSSWGGRCFEIGMDDNSLYFAGIYKDSLAFYHDTVNSINGTFDSYIYKTDLNGKYQWLRNLHGDANEYLYTLTFDSDNNIYVPGYTNSQILTVDSTDTETSETDLGPDPRGFDYSILKYSPDGKLAWKRFAGGVYDDKLVHSAFFNNEIYVSGFFTDSLNWGGINLKTTGSLDADMFVGALDSDGNFRSANSYGGTNNSEEDARAIFSDGENLFTVIQSNSEILQLGDDIYTSSNGMYYVALGIIGCNPISIDNTIYSPVTGCYGDSTGAIQISASGGFGSPWKYSIDNSDTYQDSPYFPGLPAGDYQVLVIDKENCTKVGQVVTLTQPDTLEVQLISSSDITVDADGSIVVGAQGGTSPYTYTLMPDNVLQGYGTFMFARGDSGKYVVQLTDGNLCGPVSTDTIWIQDLSSVGINELGGLMLRVFPNPATDVVTVEMPMEAAEVSMEVLSLTGQVVLSRRAYTAGGVLRETIDVSELADGMYMLRLNGETLKSAFVVN